jgi:hypothetical protein
LTASQANGLVNERFNEPLPSYICLLPFYSFVFCFQRLSRHCAVNGPAASHTATNHHTAAGNSSEFSVRMKLKHLGV